MKSGLRTWIGSFGNLLGLVLSLLPTPTLAQNHWDDLDALQDQPEFIFLAQDLNLLGQRKPASNLFRRQASILETLNEELALKDSTVELTPAEMNWIRANIQRAYDLQSSLQFARYHLYRTTLEFPQYYEKYYNSEFERLPKGNLRTHENLMIRLELERFQKLFYLRFPLVGDFLPFAGLRGHRLSNFFKFFGRPKVVTDEVLAALNSSKPLTMNVFEQLYPQLEASERTRLYGLYLHFGFFAEHPEALPANFEDFWKSIESLETFAATQIGQKEAFIFYEILKMGGAWQFSLKRNPAFKADPESPALIWLRLEFAGQNEKLRQAIDDCEKASDAGAIKELQDLIDENVADWFDAETDFDFRDALDQIESYRWVTLNAEDYAYLRLPEKARNLLAARIFPELNLRLSRAILEMSFFSLKDSERVEIIDLLFSDPQKAQAIFTRIQLLGTHPLDVAEIHIQLMKAAAERLIPPKPRALASRTFDSDQDPTDGVELPLIGPAQEEMQIQIELHKGEIDSGWYPQSLIESLMVDVYPTPNHIENEMKHFWSEWNRQKFLEINRAEIDRLKSALAKASTDAERTELKSQLEAAINLKNSKMAHVVFDPNSQASILGAIAYGITPDSWTDVKGMAKAAGIGLVFVVAVRLFGPKRVAVVLIGDTFARLVTSSYLNDNTENFLTEDLGKGYSTWLGLWTAESLQGLARLISRAQQTGDIDQQELIEDRLNAFQSLGEFGRDTAVMGFTTWGANVALPWERLSRVRLIQRYQERIAKYEAQKIEVQNRIKELKVEIERLRTEASSLEKAGFGDSTAAGKVRDQIADLHREIANREGLSVSLSTSRLAFLSRQIFFQTLRIVEVAVPYLSFGKQPKSLIREGALKKFNSERYLGLKHLDAWIEKYSRKIKDIERAQLFADARPPSEFWSLKFDTWKLAQYRWRSLRWNAMESNAAKAFSEANALYESKNFIPAAKEIQSAAKSLSIRSQVFEGCTRDAKPVGRIESGLLEAQKILEEKVGPSIRQFIEREVKAPILRRRPPPERPVIEVKDLSPEVLQTRFLREMELRLKTQLKSLRESVERLREVESSAKLSIKERAKLRKVIEATELELRKAQKSLNASKL